MFHYSDTWQLVINTGTTIITFLMVFLIQNTQNRDGAAVQAKLDELIRAHHDARNAYMGIEKLPEEADRNARALCRDGAGCSGSDVWYERLNVALWWNRTSAALLKGERSSPWRSSRT
jgi:low affinity Fe/Cu permease